MANTKVKAEQLEAAQTSITSLGTLTTLTVDDITINGSTISDAADLTIDVGGNINLDADGGNIYFKDAGVTIGHIYSSSSDFAFYSAVSDKDIVFQGNDGGSAITALTLDMSDAGAATFNSTVTATSFLGNIIKTGDLTIDVGGDIILDAGGANINFNDDGTAIGHIEMAGSNLEIKSKVSDKDIIFKGTDGGSEITALTLDMSDAGAATFNGEVLIPEKLTHAGDTDTHFKFAGANDIRIVAGNVEHAAFDVNTIVFNQSGADMDFRVESSGNASMLHVDAGNNRVGIGTNAPWRTAAIYASSQAELGFKTGSVSSGALIYYNDSEGKFLMRAQESGDHIAFQIDGSSEKMRIDSAGNVGIGTGTPGTNHAKANKLVVGSGSAGGMAVYSGTAEGWYAFSRANANNTDAYDGGMSYNGDRQLKFHTNAGGTRMMVNSDGLHFGSDTAAANALDDYEEGTFTPSWGSAAGSGSTGYGSYVKVGKMVTVQMRWTAITHSGHSGANYIRDLPFDIYQTNAVQALGMDWMGYYVAYDASKRPGFLTAGADLMYGYYSNNAGTWTQWDCNNTSSKYLMLNITYRTT